jgi:hypothetical protein
VRPAVRLSDSNHDVGAVLGTPVTLAEQRAGRAGPRRIAQVYSQTPASGRFRAPVAPGHRTSPAVPSHKCAPGTDGRIIIPEAAGPRRPLGPPGGGVGTPSRVRQEGTIRARGMPGEAVMCSLLLRRLGSTLPGIRPGSGSQLQAEAVASSLAACSRVPHYRQRESAMGASRGRAPVQCPTRGRARGGRCWRVRDAQAAGATWSLMPSPRRTLASASANRSRVNGGLSSGPVSMVPAAIRSAAAPKLFSTAIDPSTVISSL